MDRRGFLYLLGGGALGAGGIVSAQNDWDADKTVSSLTETTNGVLGTSDNPDTELTQEFGFFSSGFEKIEFKRVIASNFNGWVAVITFGSHSMDGFGIRHSSLDSIEDDLYVCKPPKSTGERKVPIIQLLNEEDAVYPTRNFDLIAYEGEFSDCGDRMQFNISYETTGSAGFTLPERIAPESSFQSQ